MEEKIVISASRSKDPVRVSPGRLAAILDGRAPVRFGLGESLTALPVDRAGALVIWTKDPAHALNHARLHRALRSFLDRTGGVIVLNLTVTGLGGTALEPGIPSPPEVRASIAGLIDHGLVDPELIILRYDPLIRVVSPGGGALGNMSLADFDSVLEMFGTLGVRRIKTSLIDTRYAHVPTRLGRAGFTVLTPADEEVMMLLAEMRSSCARFGARLDICCHPEEVVTADTVGCIDGSLINRALARAGRPWRVTTRLHNDIGRQRRTCRCTYSRDIGYSAGFQTCFKNDGACLYCYSQRNTDGPAMVEASRLAGLMRPAAVDTRPGE
jgi:hypothetical protein